MSEVQIRINKRTLERTVYLLVIVVLLALYLFKPSGSAADVEKLEARVLELTNEKTALEEQLAVQPEVEEVQEETQEETTSEPEPEPEPEPEVEEEPEEPELSGKILVDETVRFADGKVDDISLILTNERDETEEVAYKIYWEDLGGDVVNVEGEIVLSSGETDSKVILRDGEWKVNDNIPRGTNGNLVIEIRDGDNKLVEQIEKRP